MDTIELLKRGMVMERVSPVIDKEAIETERESEI